MTLAEISNTVDGTADIPSAHLVPSSSKDGNATDEPPKTDGTPKTGATPEDPLAFHDLEAEKESPSKRKEASPPSSPIFPSTDDMRPTKKSKKHDAAEEPSEESDDSDVSESETTEEPSLEAAANVVYGMFESMSTTNKSSLVAAVTATISAAGPIPVGIGLAATVGVVSSGMGMKTIVDRLTKVEERVAKVEEGLVKLEERVTKVEEGLVKLEERVAKVEERLAKVEKGVEILKKSATSTDEKLDSILDLLKEQSTQRSRWF